MIRALHVPVRHLLASNLLLSISRWQRVRAILNGDFTPLHTAPIEFTTIVMPDGSRLPLKAAESPGLNSIVSSRPPKKQTNTAHT